MIGGWIAVLSTASNKEEALRIARRIVGEKLAACVNVVDNIHSIYWWEGKVEESSEALLVIKTRVEVLDKLIDLIRRVHSYSVPEIIALPIISGYSEYLEWLDQCLH
jgi:periplasmic divalent cation tolerance protein